MNPKQIVAANMRFRRKRLGLTQAQAAERIGWTQQAWGSYETGNKSMGIEVLAEVARALEVRMVDLVNIDTALEEIAPLKEPRRRKAA